MAFRVHSSVNGLNDNRGQCEKTKPTTEQERVHKNKKNKRAVKRHPVGVERLCLSRVTSSMLSSDNSLLSKLEHTTVRGCHEGRCSFNSFSTRWQKWV